MFDYAYVPRLTVSAHRLDQLAVIVRHRAAVLVAAAAGCPWDGDGASAFRLRTDETSARLRRAATRLDEAAAALRRHAVRVEAALEVRAQEQARAAQALLTRGEHLVDRVGAVLHDIGVTR